MSEQDNSDDDPRHAQRVGSPIGCEAMALGFLASDWILRAHWVGGRKLVEDAIRFALMECGNDQAFIRERIESVQQLAKPWLWREACLVEYKRRQSVPRERTRFAGPAPISAPLARLTGQAKRPDIADLRVRLGRIADKFRAGEPVVLYGMGRINKYRVVAGKRGGLDIVSDTGARRILEPADLAHLEDA